MFIFIRPEVLELAETLRVALYAANACGGTVAQQDAAYGKIKDALVSTLASGMKDDMLPAYYPERIATALEIYESCINNGENVAYNIGVVSMQIKQRLEDERAEMVERSSFPY